MYWYFSSSPLPVSSPRLSSSSFIFYNDSSVSPLRILLSSPAPCPCLLLRRLSFLIGVAPRLLSSSACFFLSSHPLSETSSLLLLPPPSPAASLAEKDRHQTGCLPPVYIKPPCVCLCMFSVRVFSSPSFLYSVFPSSWLLLCTVDVGAVQCCTGRQETTLLYNSLQFTSSPCFAEIPTQRIILMKNLSVSVESPDRRGLEDKVRLSYIDLVG